MCMCVYRCVSVCVCVFVCYYELSPPSPGSNSYMVDGDLPNIVQSLQNGKSWKAKTEIFNYLPHGR